MEHRIFRTGIARIYPMYRTKVERKGGSAAELDAVICWLTGHDAASLAATLENGTDLEGFFAGAPALNPARDLVRGVICGVRIEEIADPLMRKIRIMDKLVDELAKGRPVAKVLRQA